MKKVFQDLKVIELASVLAGPAVGMFFAELGAEVIKVENPATGGDVTRGWRLPQEDRERSYSAYYSSVNWGKSTIALDLSRREPREQLYKLVQEADIVIANYRPGSAEKLGVDYKILKAINPGLIYANLTSFGPDNKRPAFDIVLQAETGFLYMNGEADRSPVRMPVALIDILAAHQLKEAILIALLQKERTGEGSFVSTSLYESAIASLANQATNWLMESHIPQRMGTKHPNIAPYGDIFEGSDGKTMVLAVGTEAQFQRLCDWLGREEWCRDEAYATNAARVKNRDALNLLLKAEMIKFPAADIVESLTKVAVPAAMIRNMKEVFEIPLAQKMILPQEEADGRVSKRVKTVAFSTKTE